jgi:hypothetical protein
MSYCPNCGNKIDETMAFCPRCGASLKITTPSQAAPPQPTPPQPAPPPPYGRRNEKSEKQEKQEKNQRPEKGEKGEKGEQGFIGFLIGGLILITIGVFALIELTNPSFSSWQNWAIALLIIGVIIIIGAVYVAVIARSRHPPTS